MYKESFEVFKLKDFDSNLRDEFTIKKNTLNDEHMQEFYQRAKAQNKMKFVN